MAWRKDSGRIFVWLSGMKELDDIYTENVVNPTEALKNMKATGMDGINVKVGSTVAYCYVYHLLHLFNLYSLTEEGGVKQLVKNKACPIIKKWKRYIWKF